MARPRKQADSGPLNEQHAASIRSHLERIRKARQLCNRYEKVGVNCADYRQQLDDLEQAFRSFQSEFFPNQVAT